jgi:carbonic anhydrase/acetyltransferase-like protein (isoleucine patch superfamily)
MRYEERMPQYSFGGATPKLGAGVYIAPNATVIGDVVLGDESSVWFSTVIRGDVYPIRIGARTNIQDGSVVHVTGGVAKTTIGDEVTVGHMVLLHGCTVGNRCLIGMGSVILDGAEIGDECVVAAGSLVTPRTKIPPRTMVMGRPAKAVRAVTDKDMELVWAGRDNYLELARKYASDAVTRVR